jgi:hypothetical protein
MSDDSSVFLEIARRSPAGNFQPQISVMRPHDPGYALKDFAKRNRWSRWQSTEFYDAVLAKYNEAPVGSIVTTTLPPEIEGHNFKKTVLLRGLKQDKDITIWRMSRDENNQPYGKGKRPMALLKLSHTKGRLVGREAKKD